MDDATAQLLQRMKYDMQFTDINTANTSSLKTVVAYVYQWRENGSVKMKKSCFPLELLPVLLMADHLL